MKAIEVTSDGTATYTTTLKHNDVLTIYGLTDATKYTVTETETAVSGYTTYIEYVSNDIDEVTKGTQSTTTEEKTVSECQNVTFENNKEVVAPTGIITTFAPYVAMVALAVVVAFFFLRRRQRKI